MELEKTGGQRQAASFDPDQHFLEAALRGRTARKVRAHLRRLEPVVLMTPRWSNPQTFLEEIALDLAVGEPAVGCRTVSFRPLKGRRPPEAWSFILQVLGQLRNRRNVSHPPIVADGRGFRSVALELLLRAQDETDHNLALLAHGAEYLPIDVIEDLGEVWATYVQRIPRDRRATMLLAGSVNAELDQGNPVTLADYGEAEAAAAIFGRTGPTARAHLETAARFSGGIPAVVDALGRGAREQGAMPRSRAGLVRALGPLGEEMRMAVDIVKADTELAERLQALLRGEPLVEVPQVDKPLMMAGLLRRVRLPGEDRVMLRAPAIGEVAGS
ncbi:MAG: hypothetical protein VX899_10980 [Myxococcota bacterium]|nr:hypothetical protein [Myxococcota bacterium]